LGATREVLPRRRHRLRHQRRRIHRAPPCRSALPARRLWTFHDRRGHIGIQGARFLVVSLVALGANLLVLHLLIRFGTGKLVAQAIAIIVVTPLNFIGNKLWSFRLH
jgi:hypothetical protein